MSIFDLLNLIGGLSLFLFGMNIMGQALERRAGGRLRSVLGKLTTGKLTGLITGLGITAVIQSSSATTVMVVGFVNSGLMTLKQAINVIMGANIGTTVTAWLLSLAGIDSSNIFISLLKPSSFTPVLALIGIIFYMFCKNSKKKDTGMILLGFATLMFGMEAMSGAVSGLRNVPEFQNLFIMFQNPILGVIAGTLLTAVIQSSSASVGILQALAVTGQVTYGAAIPIIMGQNIGTCVTAMISSIGANKNAKRAAMVHLSFNIIGTVVWLSVYSIIKAAFSPAIINESASLFGIAVAHSVFNFLCTVLMLPLSGFLEKLVVRLVPDSKAPQKQTKLDERLMTTPPIALERCREVCCDMARLSVGALKDSISALTICTDEVAEQIIKKERKTDEYEDELGSYLVKLSTLQISESDSLHAAKLLKLIGDLERISDHAVNVLESAQEMQSKNIKFTSGGKKELDTLCKAVEEICDLALDAFINDSITAAAKIEALEQVIDTLKEELRTRHILRLQLGKCSIEAGFVWSDLLTDLERVSDHCSNIAGCVMEMNTNDMNFHELLRDYRNDNSDYRRLCREYTKKYAIIK